MDFHTPTGQHFRLTGMDFRSGGYAMVWKAREMVNGTPTGPLLAIKQAKDDPEAIRSVREEGDLLARLASNRAELREVVVPLLARGDYGDQPFLVLPWAEHDLKKWLESRDQLLDRARAAAAVADAVVRLQRYGGTTHQDLKPANLLVAPGDVPKVWLADFGAGRRMGATTNPALRMAWTEGYAPPEQVLPIRPDTSWDTYALSVVVFECLVGWLPEGTRRAAMLAVADTGCLTPAGVQLRELGQVATGGPLAPERAALMASLKQRPVAELLDARLVEPLLAGDEVALRTRLEPLGEAGAAVVAELEARLVGDPAERVPVAFGLHRALVRLVQRLETGAERRTTVERRSPARAVDFTVEPVGQRRLAAPVQLGRGRPQPPPKPLPAPKPETVVTPAREPTRPPPPATRPAPPLARPPRRAPTPPKAQSPWARAGQLYPTVAFGPGTYTIGSPKTEDGRSSDEHQHQVRLTRGFRMGRFAVTQALCKQVLGKLPAGLNQFQGDNLPLHSISWFEACLLADALNQHLGLRSPYTFGPDDRSVPAVDWSAPGFRLPTEAEWEVAARGGGDTFQYAGSDAVDDVAWTSENSGMKLRPVGQKTPNVAGLHDMSGNVWEWCWDWHEAHRSTSTDPVGPASGSDRVFRGGSFNVTPALARVARRGYWTPFYRGFYLGVRFSRTIP